MSLWDRIEERAARTPDALFAIDEHERQLSFASYRDAALRCAAGLSKRGIGPGSVVSWQLPTRLDSLVLLAALSRLGAVQNPLLPILREREVGFITRQTQARWLLVPKQWRGFDHAAMAEALAAQGELEPVIVEAGLPTGDPTLLPPVPSGPGAWIFYTSGTTAHPKGARHDDVSLAAAAANLCERLELQPDDRVALVFPITHVGGLAWLMAGLQVGCAQIVVEAFDPKTSVDVLTRHGVTQATAGTVFHQAYLAAQRERGPAHVFPRVRAFPGGGAPKPPDLHAALKQELGGAGIVSGWGLTEFPIASMGSVHDSDPKLAHTEGRPSRGVEVRIVNGELRLRGPQAFRGYVDPALDADAFDSDGFFRTGDLGFLDPEGHVVVTGRAKDVIIRKGENISAREVEDALQRHPGVKDVAVIGLPDSERGERCCAVVVGSLGFVEMREFLSGQELARQKIPEQLETVAELPRNPSGKVLKHELRERFGAPDPRDGRARQW